MQKSEMLHWLRQEDRQWQEFLAQIDPAHLEQPGVNGDWSMKDVFAHMTGWNRWLVLLMQAAQRGDPRPAPPWPETLQSDDDVNAWIYATYRARSLQEVLDEMEQSNQQIFAVLEALPDDVRIESGESAYPLVLVNGKRFPAGEFYRHYHDEHEPDVRAWLASRGQV